MMFRSLALTFLAVHTASAFTCSTRAPFCTRSSSTQLSAEVVREKMLFDIPGYEPGKSDGELGKRYGHLAGAEIKTVGEAFGDFTKALGYTISPLFKNYMSDIVGITHLIVVNARFERDPIWSYGIKRAMDLLLKNYPEPEVKDSLYSAFYKSIGQDESEINKEAAMVEEWMSGKTKADIDAAMSGEGDSFLATLVNEKIKKDEYWMYSRYFGYGLVGLMEATTTDEFDKDTSYNIMEEWMGKLGLPHVKACRDSDNYWKVKDKLSIMETMMKEIEIREKKRMADRLEAKAEQALESAEKMEKLRKEEAEAMARASEKEETVSK